MIRGALELKDKKVADALTPLDNVFTVAEDAVVDDAFLRTILRRGHSRVPVYRGERGQFVGILLVRSLLERPSVHPLRVADLPLRPLIWADADLPLYEMLRTFRAGQTHMAAVRRVTKGGVQVRGIITLEDVLEQLLLDEIQDEGDVDKRQRDLAELEQPTPAERALSERAASAYAVIAMVKDDGAPTGSSRPQPSRGSTGGGLLNALRPGRASADADSERFLLGSITDDDDDDLDRPLI